MNRSQEPPADEQPPTTTEFNRFRDFVKAALAVPKEEIEREKERLKEKKQAKAEPAT